MLKVVAYAAFAGALAIVVLHAFPVGADPQQLVAAIESHVATGAERLTNRPGTQQNPFLAAAAAHASDPLRLEERTSASGCIAINGLPDSACTPGAVFTNATQDMICVKGYSKTVRSVSVSTKKQVYAEYGLTYPQKGGAYEVDHLIPLELGGSNDIANLFPEAAEPRPGFHEKDLVENYLHAKVCDSEVPLAYAQQQIAENWLEVWHSLTPDEVASLVAQY